MTRLFELPISLNDNSDCGEKFVGSVPASNYILISPRFYFFFSQGIRKLLFPKDCNHTHESPHLSNHILYRSDHHHASGPSHSCYPAQVDWFLLLKQICLLTSVLRFTSLSYKWRLETLRIFGQLYSHFSHCILLEFAHIRLEFSFSRISERHPSNLGRMGFPISEYSDLQSQAPTIRGNSSTPHPPTTLLSPSSSPEGIRRSILITAWQTKSRMLHCLADRLIPKFL